MAICLLAACRPGVELQSVTPLIAPEDSATPRPTLPPEITAAPAVAFPALILAERAASHTGDIDLLAHLWAGDSRVFDRRGQADPAHFYVWAGQAAVLNRYRVAVFPHAPPRLTPEDLAMLEILEDGHAANGRDVPREGTVVTAGNGTDQWEMVWREDRWWLLTLSYSSQ